MWNISQSLRAKVLWVARVNSVNRYRHRKRDELYLYWAERGDRVAEMRRLHSEANDRASHSISEAHRLLANAGLPEPAPAYIILP